MQYTVQSCILGMSMLCPGPSFPGFVPGIHYQDVFFNDYCYQFFGQSCVEMRVRGNILTCSCCRPLAHWYTAVYWDSGMLRLDWWLLGVQMVDYPIDYDGMHHNAKTWALVLCYAVGPYQAILTIFSPDVLGSPLVNTFLLSSEKQSLTFWCLTLPLSRDCHVTLLWVPDSVTVTWTSHDLALSARLYHCHMNITWSCSECLTLYHCHMIVTWPHSITVTSL